MEQRVSQKLFLYAQELQSEYSEGLSPEERAKADKNLGFIEKATNIIISSREKFAPRVDDVGQVLLTAISQMLVESEEVMSYSLDEQYSILQLEMVPSLVQRTTRLAHLAARSTPSTQTNRYVLEASRAYIQGLDLASVVMSRAALEQALKEKVKRPPKDAGLKLADLITEAGRQRILNRVSVRAARDLVHECNLVAHNKPTKDADAAYEIITGVRSLLEEIYAA